MSVDLDRILELLMPSRVNLEVGMAHDEARERFSPHTLKPRDWREFKLIVTTYYQHHQRCTGQGTPTEEQAFGDVKRLLDNLFEEDEFQKGYNIALQMALEGQDGGLRQVLNKIADALRGSHLRKYFDHVYGEYINPLSGDDLDELSHAYFRRFGHLMQQFGIRFDERTFGRNPEAALRYHLEALEKIFKISRRVG